MELFQFQKILWLLFKLCQVYCMWPSHYYLKLKKLTPHFKNVNRKEVFLPKNDWNTADIKSIFFLPNLSESMPARSPPVATPMRKIISATIFRCFLSHTKFHSLLHVFPKLSVMLNSHSWHVVIAVWFDMKKSSCCVRLKKIKLLLRNIRIDLIYIELLCGNRGPLVIIYMAILSWVWNFSP